MMKPRPADSLPPAYFEAKYAEKLDYWDFETSAYEAAKYAHTLRALPRLRYGAGFEIGCSIGVLTESLAERCDRLLAVDVAEKALAVARARCPQVRVERMRFPRERPVGEQFDLIVVSEVGYYWSTEELAEAQRVLLALLETGGDLLLVHWTSAATDYPLTGDEVHESFRACRDLESMMSETCDRYRLDLFRRKPPRSEV